MTDPQPRNDLAASCLMAFQFLTRLPVPSPGLLSSPAAGRSLLFYPLVGLAIGLILLVLQQIFTEILPEHAGAQAALLLTIWCLLTGGLHLDGLADSADAWVGGLGDKARTLEIMKDPYAGPAGVMITVLTLLGKWAFLTALLEAGHAFWWLAPLMGRGVLLLLFITVPYARPGGLGDVLANHLPRGQLEGLLIGLALLFFFIDAAALLLCLVVFAGLRGLMLKRLEGTTGDTAGATVEIVEWNCLLGMLIGF